MEFYILLYNLSVLNNKICLRHIEILNKVYLTYKGVKEKWLESWILGKTIWLFIVIVTSSWWSLHFVTDVEFKEVKTEKRVSKENLTCVYKVLAKIDVQNVLEEKWFFIWGKRKMMLRALPWFGVKVKNCDDMV